MVDVDANFPHVENPPWTEEEAYVTDEEDSDDELVEAFRQGRLKPGLNLPVDDDKVHIYDEQGLEASLKEIKLNLDWIETLDLTNKPAPSNPATSGQLYAGPAVDDDDDIVHNDFKRELIFYRQAQASAMEALERLKSMGIPTKRPEDYFAQMAKTDDHMTRVRKKLLTKQQIMERSEKARKLRELKKFGKKVQTEVLQQRQKEKREMLDAVKKYKKGQKDKLDLDKEDENKKAKNPGMKRQNKNKKYGFGGQKKRSKSNTRDSAAEMGEYNPKKHGRNVGDKRRGASAMPGNNKSKGNSRQGQKKNTKNQRPGKNKRHKMKSGGKKK